MWRPGAALLFLAASAAAFAAPEVLVVQRLSTKDGDFNVPVAMRLTEELDIEGRVAPILWSMLDPVFRAYVDDGKLPRYVENPDDRTIRDYAGRLKVAYVLIVEAIALNGQVVPQATLYSGNSSRPMWSMVRQNDRGRPRLVVIENGRVDEDKTKEIREKYSELMEDGSLSTMTVLVNGQPDWVSTADTLARTWTRILAEGPFKDLQPQRRTFPVDPDPGLGFNPGTNVVDTGPEVAKALEQARLLTADGHVDEAILVLRDAIDTAPFASEVRIKHAELLILRGHARIAADETERAANLTDKPAQMWKTAADAWVQAGEPDKALNACNEAMARGTPPADLTVVQGDLWMLKGDVAKAVEYYDEALLASPTARAHLGRAVARVILGDATGAVNDLESAQGRDPLPIEGYRRTMDQLDVEVDKLIGLLRSVSQGVRLENGPDMVPSAAAVHQRMTALVEFMVRVRVPARHKESHEGRDLAYKLLAQTAVETLEFAKTKSVDADLEAALSLGEALKLLPRVRETYRIERTYGPKTAAN